jgi:hypothetical protein
MIGVLALLQSRLVSVSGKSRYSRTFLSLCNCLKNSKHIYMPVKMSHKVWNIQSAFPPNVLRVDARSKLLIEWYLPLDFPGVSEIVWRE